MKFQWSKVASVLGSYKDFLHAYTMSLDSTNFSQGQIAAQLDTIDRKFQQLKATVTGIATGMGASGLSAYIKNILTSLNSFAKALQRIPTWVWKIVGGFVAVSAAVGAALLVVKLFAGGIAAITGAMAAYTVAATAGTVATEGIAAAVTAATGGLNILLALVISAAAAFLGYNAVVGSLSEATDQETQSLEDNIQVKRQQIEMSEKQGEMIETLCNSHVKLQEALNTTQEGTEQHKRAEEDLAATDQALTEIIGEDAMRQIDWNGDLQGSINSLKNTHSEKTRQLRMELAQSLDAQASYQEAESARIEATITNLETEGTAWTTLGHIIESVLHGIGTAMVTLGEGIQSAGGAIKELFPSAGESLQSLGSSVMLSGINHQNFHSEWSDDRADNASKIAELKGKLTQSKLSAARARTEADAIRSTGGSSNPYAVSGAGDSDSGIVPNEEAGSKSGTGKGARSGGGAGRQVDNSVEAMGYRYLKGKGIDANFALGLLANAAHESSFNPDATNGDHWGMFQWDSTRWGAFLNDYLSQRNMSQSEYYNSDVDTKRALQYDYALYELKQGNESGSYQEILSKAPSTPEQWAHLLNMYWERSGVYSGGTDWERQKTSREYMERFGRNGGEANYTDVLKEMQKTYQTAKAQFDADVAKLKYERELKGERVTPAEIKAMYEKSMGVKDGKSAFDAITNYQKDYMKVNLDYAKEIQKAQQYVEKATQTQVSAIEKMADAEVAFSEKIGLMSKQDVWNYNYRKNESNYASGKAKFDAQLGSTVDTSKGTADDMLSALQGLIDAQNQAEAKLYADRIMWLSKDIEATKKALDERLKLEEKYQQERYKLEQEEFLRKNKYVYGFVDSFVDAWSSGMESILNRTKSFGEALRDMFKQLSNAIIKMFVDDWAARLKNILSKTIHSVTNTGYASGTNHDRGSMAGQFTGAALGNWASSSLSSLKFGGGKAKAATAGANASGMFTEYLIPTSGVTAATKRINQVTRAATAGANAVAAATTTASTAATATVTANETAQTAAHTTSETTQTGVTVANAEARTQVTNQAHANVMANIGAMITQMLAAIAIMAVFSALFGGGGSSTSESTSSVNLGRSPDSYYMTPTPVMQSTTFTVPSMDIGGNIEKDMLIYAHKNEMVLTPEQADVIRSTAKNGGSVGGSGSNASIKSNITVSTVDSRGFDRVLRNYNRDLSKQVKKGIRNGYLNANGLV